MSISSTVSRNDYVGNGAADTYPYTFRIFLKGDLLVTERDTDGVETTLTVDVDYTVSGVGDDGGGSIVLTAGNLTTDYGLTIRRVIDLKQETDIRNQGVYYPEIHEDQFDRDVMIAQQQQDEIDRAVRNPETVPVSDFDPQLPSDIATASRALITNTTGDGFTLGLPAFSADRLFNSATYAALKALALADPTSQRFGWATDIQQLVFYTANISVGDAGFIVVGG